MAVPPGLWEQFTSGWQKCYDREMEYSRSSRTLLTALTIFLSLSLFIAAGPAAAQIPGDEKTGNVTEKAEDIPDKYIEEAYEFNNKCETDFVLSQYYNCDCLAVKYLDKRIETGPRTSAQSIMMSINKECKDAARAAGYYYQQCMENSQTMGTDVPTEDFCKCLGNTYAKLYEHYDFEPGSKVFVNLQAQALVACRDPNAAKRLFRYVPNP
jgi:hypothetical protein